MVKDAIGRSWQLGTIQVDYNLPERFELEYVDADNSRKRPVMIHRAPFGSMERFIAVLLEHCGGNLPMWLAPLQVKVLPISDKFSDYAHEVAKQLKSAEIRAEVDDRNEKIGKKNSRYRADENPLHAGSRGEGNERRHGSRTQARRRRQGCRTRCRIH